MSVILLCVGFISLVRTIKPNPEEILRKRITERSLGGEKASLWITEYFDYQCPPCAMARKVLENLIAQHPDKIYLQVRYFPLAAHKNSMKAAIYAECASAQKGKFWKFHEQLFENQNQWAADQYPELKFAGYAGTAGLDMKRLDACVSDPTTEKTVIEERDKGSGLGVKMTPSFFVNGKLVIGIKSLEDEIKPILEEKK